MEEPSGPACAQWGCTASPPARRTPRRCAATYFSEANVLVSLRSVAEKSRTPTSKSVIITVSPAVDMPALPAGSTAASTSSGLAASRPPSR